MSDVFEDMDEGSEAPPKAAPESSVYDLPMVASPGSRDLRTADLAGVETMTTAKKLWLMHPYALLMAFGAMWVTLPINAALATMMMIGLTLYSVTMAAATRSSRSTALSRARKETLLAPSSALKAGLGIFGAMGLAATAASFAGGALFEFFVLNGTWGALSLFAVYQASKSDAQTGWMTGASAMAVPCTFFGIMVAIRAVQIWPFWSLTLWPVLMVPLLCMGAIWQSWNYLSTRGRDRTASSLKALAFASLATIFYLPATSFFWSFSIFEALIHLGLPIAAFAIPLWMNRERVRQVSAASQPEYLEGQSYSPKADVPVG